MAEPTRTERIEAYMRREHLSNQWEVWRHPRDNHRAWRARTSYPRKGLTPIGVGIDPIEAMLDSLEADAHTRGVDGP